jgi:TolB protein
MGVDGNGLRQSDVPEDYPVWSPDGRQIAFLSDRDRVWEIYLMDVNGSNQRRLTYENSHVYSFAWLP